MPGTIDDLLDSSEPRTVTVKVAVRGSAASEAQRLAERITAAVANGDDPTVLRDQLNDLGEEVEANTVELTFTAMTRTQWSKLLRQHPPKKADREQGYDYDPVSFPPEAMARCCDDLSPAQAQQLADKLTAGEFDRIWQGCLEANVAVEDATSVPLFASSIAGALNFGGNSTTAASVESPTASS